MKALVWFFVIALPLTGACADVELVAPAASARPVGLFGGGQRSFQVSLRNRTEANLNLSLDLQLLQATSSTVAPWGEPRPWRQLTLAPRQTIMERVQVELPNVAEESPFLLRLVSGREIVGVIEMRVSPGGLLTPLTNTLGPVMVAAISSELRQVLTESGFTLFERGQPRASSGALRLAIYGAGTAGSSAELQMEALAQARTGTGIVWIEPTDSRRFWTAPSYFPVTVGHGVFVTVQEGTLMHLSTDPAAQLKLARIVRLALRQETLHLPKSAL